MEKLPQILFWAAIVCIPLSWVLWYIGPNIELIRPVLGAISDPALRAAMQEAHAERWGIFVGLWPATLMIASLVVEKRTAS